MTIDLDKPFEHLPKAPIVEAVIELRARAGSDWGESVLARLKARLPEYSQEKTIRGLSFEVTFGGPKGQPSAETSGHEDGWHGIQFESADPHRIVKFTRDSFSFSRLQPYENWDQFSTEAMRLWDIHRKLANPSEVQRLGVRFINRLNIQPGRRLHFADYFVGLGETPTGLLTTRFLHRDELDIPDLPYHATVTRTSQTSDGGIGILLDIDVFCNEPLAPQSDTISARLPEMRSIKNHIFFASMTRKALDLCR